MSQNLSMILPLVLLVAVMYFLLIRPQKKREKQVTAMRSSVKVGDEVVTIGGIRGKIVKTRDEILTIQVGSDKVKFEIMRWAISKIENASDEPVTKASEDETGQKKAIPKKMTKASDKEEDATSGESAEAEDEEPQKTKKPKKMGKSEEE